MYAYYAAYTRREFDYGIRNKRLTFVYKKVFGNYFSHQYHTPRRPLVNIKLNVKYVFVVIVTIDKLIKRDKSHIVLASFRFADCRYESLGGEKEGANFEQAWPMRREQGVNSEPPWPMRSGQGVKLDTSAANESGAGCQI